MAYAHATNDPEDHMARETIKQRNQRWELLLADYKNRTEELNKLLTIQKGLKAQIEQEDIPAGVYGDWVKASGTPRMITDMDAVRQHYTEINVEIPLKQTSAPLVVTPKVGK